MGWYNAAVGNPFKLPYVDDTLCAVVISKPDMFEKSVKPFIFKSLKEHGNYPSHLKDPIDESTRQNLHHVTSELDIEVEIIQDFQLTPTRRPRVLVQTAGHVSGAVRYYQRCDILDDPWDPLKKVSGVCIHPRYGGWFALRAIIIFPMLCPDLKRKVPDDVIPNQEDRIRLLELFNWHWRDWRYRDVIPVQERYSEEQKTYLATKPSERFHMLNNYKPYVNQICAS
ncbi:unnamed protein product [Darwinula stevensoni]|uniref:Cyanocobalamin reductase (cyanide-eliminating) n=1 Tax=Darwinula stevensoni TaxID=69355 RepID=A0A7R9FQS0_9CRUS|nr:unnamed protein product [Darwinula stevensoni]CAG0900032.1 unnamed protein product [Darwinula stevensoni]